MDSAIGIGIIIATLVILLLIAGITISFFMISREKTNKEIALSQAKLSHEQELRKVENQLSEELLQRFSRELHDSVGSQLTRLRLEIENRKLDNEIVEREMEVADHYLDETIDQLRLLSRSLSTDYIRQNGLIASLELEIARYRQLKRYEIAWSTDYDAGRLDGEQELALFRIFQEGMNNAAKYAQASKLTILLYGQEVTELEISDNGVGFDLSMVMEGGKASGLVNMQKRAELAGFTMKIESAKSQGTTLKIQKVHQSLATENT